MKKVEIIYDCGCLNVEVARKNLRKAIDKTGVSFEWKEWKLSDSDLPAYVKTYGSPTILVNGCDVTGAQIAESGGT